MSKAENKIRRETPMVSRLTPGKIRFMLIFALPTFLLYFWLYIYPMFSSVATSFTSWNGFDAEKQAVGFLNYKNILTDPVFWKSLANDFIIVFWKEILITLISLLFAVVMTRVRITRVERAAYKFLFYIPNILSIIVITTTWTFILNPSIGLFNGILRSIGLESLIPENGWLVTYTLPWIIIIATWCAIGLYMVLLISAINNVPLDLYEASQIDGAGQWSQFFAITMPEIWPQIRYMLVTVFFGTLASNMGLILPLTNGGPDNKSMVMGLFIYQKGMDNYRVGYANAGAVIFMIICMVFSYAINKYMSKREEN